MYSREIDPVKAVDPDKDYNAMDRLTGLLKEHHIGEWCKRAAWIIAAIGLIQIILAAYSLVLQIQQINTGNYPVSLWPIVESFAFPLSIIAQATFFFFTLYAAGTFINNFIGGIEDENEEREDELLAEDEGEGIIPGQFTDFSPE
jgi:hypothetical protein